MSRLEAKLNVQMKALCKREYVREHRFAPPRRYRFDFAIPELKIGIEVEGGTWSKGRHSRGIGYQKDCEKYNLATVSGWMIIRGDSHMVKDGRLIGWIIKAIEYRSNMKENTGDVNE